MRTFKTKKKYVIITMAIIGVFYLLGIGFLIYEALDGIRNIFAYLALIVLVMMTPVFLTIVAVLSLNSYFIFYDDFFEYHKHRKTIIIKGQNIRYFYFKDGLLTIYFVKDDMRDIEASYYKESLIPENSKERAVALPEDKELFKVLFSLGMIEDAQEIISWFYENIPILPDGQALNDILGILEKYENPNPKDVNTILAKANKYAKIINILSVVLAVWCAIVPYPYRLSIELNLLLPFILLLIINYSDGWIHFDKRGNSIYPTVCLGAICPVFGLGWRMLEDYMIISTGRFMKFAALFYAVYLILFLICCRREYSFKERYTYFALLAYSFYFFGFALAAVAAINCVFDFSEPVQEIIDNNKGAVMVHNGLFGIKWY